MKFLAKMQQIFNNTRVQIKSEVFSVYHLFHSFPLSTVHNLLNLYLPVQALKSNMQKKTIDNMLSDLKEMTAEYDQPSPDKKVNPLIYY